MKAEAAVQEMLDGQLRELHLPTIRSSYEEMARQAEQETLSYERYLLGLCERECQERRWRRIERLVRQSRLPLEKTFETFDLKRLPAKVARQVQSLREGDFVGRKENLLAFGKPGSGKTHLLCALAHALVQRGPALRRAGHRPDRERRRLPPARARRRRAGAAGRCNRRPGLGDALVQRGPALRRHRDAAAGHRRGLARPRPRDCSAPARRTAGRQQRRASCTKKCQT